MPDHDSGYRCIELDQGPDAPAAARRALREWLPDLPATVQENALIAVTELVVNAVRFGSPPIHVSVTLAADVLMVEVRDQGKNRPRRRVPAEDGGIGLNLVHLLADRVEIEAGRSCVSCEFGTSGGPADV
jgi:anti-sigma regulatory factor (Ser/Thr protein kinase)